MRKLKYTQTKTQNAFSKESFYLNDQAFNDALEREIAHRSATDSFANLFEPQTRAEKIYQGFKKARYANNQPTRTGWIEESSSDKIEITITVPEKYRSKAHEIADAAFASFRDEKINVKVCFRIRN